jgi:enamine deaminase RidA (YjgF/YER057c/UK114 family)
MSIPSSRRFYGPGDLSYSHGVMIPAGQRLFFTCGIVPTPIDAQAPKGGQDRFGDTYLQAKSVLKNLAEVLSVVGLGLQDVVHLRIYLVPDKHKGHQVDYLGWFKAYNEHFNNELNPSKPPRATLSVPGLVDKDWLIEIEAVAVFAVDK